jgi:hypothetical protein
MRKRSVRRAWGVPMVQMHTAGCNYLVVEQ